MKNISLPHGSTNSTALITRLLAATLFVGSFTAPVAHAIDYTYTPPATGTGGTDSWTTSTFWASSTPVSAVDTRLFFGGTLDASAAVVTSNNVSNPFQLNNLTFNASGPAIGTAPTYTISGSQLQFINNGTTTPTITLNSGGTVKPTLTISAPLNLANDLTINATTNATITGLISGANSLAVVGPGTVTLNTSGNNNSFGGANETITVSSGGLLRGVASNSGSYAQFGNTGTKIILNGGGIEYTPTQDPSGNFNYSIELQTGGTNTIRGTGVSANRGLYLNSTLTGAGGFTNALSNSVANYVIGKIDGTSTLTGTVTSATGTIYVRADGTIDALGGGTAGGANLLIAGGNFVFGGSSASPVSLVTFSRSIAVGGNQGLSVSNNYTFTHTGALTGSSTLNVNNVTASSRAVSAVGAVNGAGANSVVVLNGDLSGFTGNVAVPRGTLLIGGTLGSTSTLGSGGTLSMSSGSRLGGHGTIIRDATVGSGVTLSAGALAPGLQAGSLEFGGNLAINNAASTTAIELGGTSFSLNTTEQYDRIKLTGATPTLTLAGTLNVALIDGFSLAQNQAFGIFQLGAGSTRSGTFGGLATDGALVGNFGGQDLYITYSANFGDSGAILLEGGNDIALYTIPEPTTFAMLVGGFGVLLSLQRRHRRT